ncbi:MAG: anthranilate phosphoribosyltransferase, partial [Clostridia bacterium]|nr:anthranilate phosphoribosyltransferase [Clostridia bacterium]
VFNILGPLTNPAQARRQVLGVFSEELVEPLAHVLVNLGVKRGMVVYGQDRLDEISVSAPTTVCEFQGDAFTRYILYPEAFGLERAEKSALVGGTPQENARITLSVLQGERGAKRDAVLLNAGAGLYIAGCASSLSEGVACAARLIDTGDAMAKLEAFRRESNRKATA